jgi:excisionase family DNA binding protein
MLNTNKQKLAALVEPLLTTHDLSRLLSVSTRFIQREVAAGRMPQPIKLGRLTRFSPESIRAWLETNLR